jgi:hypothetical protein
VAALVAFVVVGPAFRPGVVLSYDLAWSPDPRFTPFALGTTGLAPRAVPSDVVAIVLGQVLGAGIAQSLLLWGVLVLAGSGVSRLASLLVPGLGVVGRAVAAVAAIWNPFVLERLVVGHWTVLLAYAAVPHLWVACVRARRGVSPAWSPAVGLAACGVGGANALVICGLAVLPVLAARVTQWRALTWAIAALSGVSCVWALPAALARVTSAPEGVTAFASRADTPLGVLGSLVSGGGFWNQATHPSGRSVALVAVAAVVLAGLSQLVGLRAARARHLLALAVPGVVGLTVAWLSAVDPFGAWSAAVVHLPGGGILRDAQKLIAPWVAFTAAGCGVLVRDVLRWKAAGPALAIFIAALPVALLPSLAWGVGGRVVSVEVPADLRVTSERLSESAGGTVGLLPWSQYRRYAWNGERVSLTLVPRMVSQRVLFDDSLPLASGAVAGEDPAARRVGERIAGGSTAFDALAAEGVRWVVVEKQTGLPTVAGLDRLPRGAVVTHDGPNATIVELPGATKSQGPSAGWRAWLGWTVTCLTWAAAIALRVRDSAWPRRHRLVGSAP